MGARSFLGIKCPGHGINYQPPSIAETKEGTRSFLEVKWLRCGINHPTPPCSAKINNRVKLYLYSPSVSSWQVIG